MLSDQSIVKTEVQNVWLEFQQHMLDLVISWTPKLIACTLIFLVFFIFSILVRYLLQAMENKAPPAHQPVFLFLGYASKFSILAIGSITALGSAGVNVSALVASLGLSGFAISFAMKDTLSNMIAGMMLLLFQPFSVGDRIEVGSEEGDIIKINLRYTCLTDQTHRYLIPNATLLSKTVKVLKKPA